MIAFAPMEGWAEADVLGKLWLLITTSGRSNELQFAFAVLGLAVMLLAVGWRSLVLYRARKTDPGVTKSWLRWGERMVSAALLVAALCSATQYFYGSRNNKTWLHTWDIFHQVLGTKYFEELGYFRLYECTWEIDEMYSGHFKRVPKIRDIETLRVPPTEEAVGERDCVDLFSPERLEEFHQDIEHFHALGGHNMWNTLFTDKGFNGTPFHAWILSEVTDGVPIVWDEFIWLGLIDVGLMMLAFTAIAWAWDVKTAAIVILFFCANFPNRYLHMGGSILRFDYIAMLIFALVAMKKGWFAVAGACVAWATAERAFPAIFAVGLGFKAGVELLATRKLAREYLYFGLGFVGTGLILFGLSLTLCKTPGEGVDAWVQWWENIKVHTAHTRGFRVGFKHMFMMDGNLTDKHEFVGWSKKTEFFHTRDHYFYLTVLMLLAPLLLAVRKLDAVTFAALFAAAGFFFLTVATRYYYSMMVLFLLVDRKLFDDRKQLLLAALLFLTAAWLAKLQMYTDSVPFHYNTATTAAFAGYYVILASLLWIDPWLRDRSVLGAESTPEPDPAAKPGSD